MSIISNFEYAKWLPEEVPAEVMSKASSVGPIFTGDLNPFHFRERYHKCILYGERISKETPHLRRENVCGEFLGLVEGLRDWS